VQRGCQNAGDAIPRVCDPTIEHGWGEDTPIDLPLTQAQLAARLGTVRELVARALAELQGSGVIARRHSTSVIQDPERLAALARGEASEAV